MTQHVIQRGNNRSDIFRSPGDYEVFLVALHDACTKHKMDVHAYALMTNHVHLLVTPRVADAVSLAIQSVGRRYVQYFNRRYLRTGALFEGRYRSLLIDTESYWFVCMRYVELNPVRAGLVPHPETYRWSSYSSNAFGAPDQLVVPHPLYLALGDSPGVRQRGWRAICAEALTDAQLAEIRQAVRQGGALNSVVIGTPDSTPQS